MNNGNANGDSLSGEESENIGKTANVSANHRRPAPPKMGRPAPPKTGPPAPPKVGRPAPPNHKQSSDLNSQIGAAPDSDPVLQKARELENVCEYNEAAILYRSIGLTNDENRCLQLALSKSQSEKTTIIHNGDKIIRDSVIMNDEN